MPLAVRRLVAKGLGVVILILTLTPLYRVLDRPESGSFGEGTIIRASTHLQTALWGTVLAVGVGGLFAFLFGTQGLRDRLASVGATATRVSATRWALVCGVVAAGLASAAHLVVFDGFPSLVDEMSTLLSARAMASGRLAIPLPEATAAWVIPNTLMTPAGWVSQYPPMSPLLLALGYFLAAPGLVGPLLLGLGVGVTVLVAARLLPDQPAVVRLAGFLLAVSPFLLLIGAGYLSHVPAATFTALAIYATLRARDGVWTWSIMTGVTAGLLVTTRPWIGLVLGVAFPTAIWLAQAVRGRTPRWWVSRAFGATLGGLPFAVGLVWYDTTLYGSALTMGYDVAYGPAHALGFHADPWGNVYGPLEALGYSAANLLTLGVYLLESPVPTVPLVALFLLTSRRLPEGVWILLAWALLPVLANTAYWHHGFHLGPRMLYEAAPAWVVLTALAAIGLTHRDTTSVAAADRGASGTTASPAATTARSRPAPRDVLLWALCLSLAAAAVLGPLRAGSYAWSDEVLARIVVPEVPGDRPALVFVHGSWGERISGRLQGHGMRLDSIESGLRRNDACRLHTYAMRRTSGAGVLPTLDFELLPGTPDHLRNVELVEGSTLHVDPGLPVPPECAREARADRFGVISLAPLVWQGDLPGIESGRPMFVRDLGPVENEAILAVFPERTPWLYRTEAPSGEPVLIPYARGIAELWGTPDAAPAEAVND